MKLMLLLLALFTAVPEADYTFTIAKKVTVGQVIGTVVATDPDQGQKLTYAFINGNTNTSFKIDPLTGVITVSNAAFINSMKIKYYNITVKVTDNGKPPLSARAIVRINIML